MKQIYRYPIDLSTLVKENGLDKIRLVSKEQALQEFMKDYALTDTNKIEIKETITFENERNYYMITITSEDLGSVENG